MSVMRASLDEARASDTPRMGMLAYASLNSLLQKWALGGQAWRIGRGRSWGGVGPGIGRGRLGEQDHDPNEAEGRVDQPKDGAAPSDQPPGRAGAEQQAHH
jgi:hypothetical protein